MSQVCYRGDMVPDELIRFINAAKKGGAPQESIRQQLLSAGWKADVVNQALGTGAQPETAVPVVLPPAPPPPYASIPVGPVSPVHASYPLRSFMVVLVIILGVLAYVAAFFVGGAYITGLQSIRKTNAAASDFLKLVESGNYAGAYMLTSARFQDQANPELFAVIMKEVAQKTGGTFAHGESEIDSAVDTDGTDLIVWKATLNAVAGNDLTLAFTEENGTLLLYDMSAPIIKESIESIRQRIQSGEVSLPVSTGTDTATPTRPMNAQPTISQETMPAGLTDSPVIPVEDGVSLQITNLAKNGARIMFSVTFTNTSGGTKTVYPIRITIRNAQSGGGSNTAPPQKQLSAGQTFTQQYDMEELPGGSPYTFQYVNSENKTIELGKVSY